MNYGYGQVVAVAPAGAQLAAMPQVRSERIMRSVLAGELFAVTEILLKEAPGSGRKNVDRTFPESARHALKV